METLKPVGIPSKSFESETLISLTGFNYKLAAFSENLKYIAVSRSYSRRESEVMDIVLVRLKDQKEFLLLDTLTMIRYGRPNGILYDLFFNDQEQLVAKISDGMKGTSILTFDLEQKELVKDEYLDDYYEEEGEESCEEGLFYEEKMEDLKKLYPKKDKISLSELVYKLMPVDSVGYLTQGIIPNDNSIFYLPRGEGKLRLIHNISDPAQIDNIDGVWGNKEKVVYFLKDQKNNYLFRYDVKLNRVTLLEKYPAHTHFSYIYAYQLNNEDVLLAFEVEINKPEADETMKMLLYSKGVFYKIEDYTYIQDIKYLAEKDLLLLYHLKDGKRCLDVRQIIP